MSYFVKPVLVPGYEDYERLIEGSSANTFPEMWPAEWAANAAVIRRYNQWCAAAPAHLKPAQRHAARVLADLARDNGWQLNEAAAALGVIVYVIPSNDVPFPQVGKADTTASNPLCDLLNKRIRADVNACTSVCVKPDDRIHRRTPGMPRELLQRLVLLDLAKENGMKKNHPEDKDCAKKIYQIR